jgi:hypothetical protein
MEKALEETFRWLTRWGILTNEEFQIFIMRAEGKVEPSILIISDNYNIIGHGIAATYTEAFIEAIGQARHKLI